MADCIHNPLLEFRTRTLIIQLVLMATPFVLLTISKANKHEAKDGVVC